MAGPGVYTVVEQIRAKGQLCLGNLKDKISVHTVVKTKASIGVELALLETTVRL
jgi:hypothetical protein